MSEDERPGNAKVFARSSGPLVTLATLVCIEGLSQAGLTIANPAPVYFAAVAYSVFSGGLSAGLLSMAMTLLHAVYVLSPPGERFHYAGETVVRIAILAVTLLIVVLFVPPLKRRVDRSLEVSEANAVLKGQLLERARAQEAAKALAQVGRKLAETLDFGRAADRVVFTVVQLFRVTRAVLYRLDEASGSLVCVATGDGGDPGRWIGQTLPAGAGLAGRAVAEGRAIWCADLLAEPGLGLPEWAVERFREEGYRAAVALPLIARGKAVGALALAAPLGRVFTDEEIRLLSIFADQAALALENTRLYGELETALEELKASQQRTVQAERLQAIEEVAEGVAHHLRNLLQVILWQVQLLLKAVQEGEIRRALESVEQSVQNANDLIRKLQGFTQARPASEAAPVDLNQVARDALEVARALGGRVPAQRDSDRGRLGAGTNSGCGRRARPSLGSPDQSPSQRGGSAPRGRDDHHQDLGGRSMGILLRCRYWGGHVRGGPTAGARAVLYHQGTSKGSG